MRASSTASVGSRGAGISTESRSKLQLSCNIVRQFQAVESARFGCEFATWLIFTARSASAEIFCVSSVIKVCCTQEARDDLIHRSRSFFSAASVKARASSTVGRLLRRSA